MLTLQNSNVLFLEVLEKLQFILEIKFAQNAFVSGERPVLENINMDISLGFLLLFLALQKKPFAEPELKGRVERL